MFIILKSYFEWNDKPNIVSTCANPSYWSGNQAALKPFLESQPVVDVASDFFWVLHSRRRFKRRLKATGCSLLFLSSKRVFFFFFFWVYSWVFRFQLCWFWGVCVAIVVGRKTSDFEGTQTLLSRGPSQAETSKAAVKDQAWKKFCFLSNQLPQQGHMPHAQILASRLDKEQSHDLKSFFLFKQIFHLSSPGHWDAAGSAS